MLMAKAPNMQLFYFSWVVVMLNTWASQSFFRALFFCLFDRTSFVEQEGMASPLQAGSSGINTSGFRALENCWEGSVGEGISRPEVFGAGRRPSSCRPRSHLHRREACECPSIEVIVNILES